MRRKMERIWVLADEYKDWKSLANDGDKYKGIAVKESQAFDYIHDEEDIDYDDYLIWYSKNHPKTEPNICEIVKDKDSIVSCFLVKVIGCRCARLC